MFYQKCWWPSNVMSTHKPSELMSKIGDGGYSGGYKSSTNGGYHLTHIYTYMYT